MRFPASKTEGSGPPLPRVGSPAAYAWGIGAVLAAAIVRAPLDQWAGAPLPPFVTFFPSIWLAGFLGGLRVGVVSAAAALGLAWYFWIPAYGSWALPSRLDVLTLLVLVVSGTLLALMSGYTRLLLNKVRESEHDRTRAAQESTHRIKNLIAIVHALLNRSAMDGQSLEAFRHQIGGQLRALASAQDQLVMRDWKGVSLDALITGALAPFMSFESLKIEGGPNLSVPPVHASGLSLALYELATNAVKYGALGPCGGAVTVSWRIADGACVLEWKERCAVQGAAPQTEGLGGGLIRSALANGRDTHVDYTLMDTGAQCTFVWPLEP